MPDSFSATGWDYRTNFASYRIWQWRN